MKSILLTVILSCLLVSCRFWSANRITLESNSAPLTFKLSGADEVQWIWVQGPFQNGRDQGPKPPPLDDPKKIIIWKIVPAEHFVPMDEVPPVTYGQIPGGWQQETPKAESPPPLLDGYVYHLRAIPVRGEGPLLCVSVKGGQIQPYKDDPASPECK
ncbi:MAG TPA: hypothetical protein VLB87_15275 [Pyrinomonadaceae bacterium]|nr:hypothetical protein [Pyrinomonadaceae bacterium]